MVDRLDGEQVSERVIEVVIDDLVVVDENVLEDGLVEASADFVAGVNRPDFRSYRELCPASAGPADSWSA